MPGKTLGSLPDMCSSLSDSLDSVGSVIACRAIGDETRCPGYVGNAPGVLDPASRTAAEESIADLPTDPS